MSLPFDSFDLVRDTDGGCVADAVPLPDLVRRGVLRYFGFAAGSGIGFQDIAPAELFLPVIITLEGGWEIASAGGEGRLFKSFGAGLIDASTTISSVGRPVCLQLDLSPFAARAVLGRPLHELTGDVIDLPDLLGTPGIDLIDRIASVTEWPQKLVLVDRFVRNRMQRAAPADPRVLAGWRMLGGSGGLTRVADMAEHLNCSREHLSRLFREQAGHSPKTIGRIMRFRTARRKAMRGPVDWSDLAFETGYADQAHLVREFRRMSGETPASWHASHSFNTRPTHSDTLL